MQILSSLRNAPRVARHGGQVSWTTSGLVSASVHALTVVLLFVGGGIFRDVQVFPTQRRQPTVDIVSRPAEPDESAVDATMESLTSTAPSIAPQRTPPPENRPAETKIPRSSTNSSLTTTTMNSPPAAPADHVGPMTQARKRRRNETSPTLQSPSRTLPSSIGQTGAESKLLPVKIYNPAPEFPKSKSAVGKFGTVHLMIVVNRQGIVVDVKVETSSGFSEFDVEAVKTVRKWRFLPAFESTTGDRRCRQQVEFLPR